MRPGKSYLSLYLVKKNTWNLYEIVFALVNDKIEKLFRAQIATININTSSPKIVGIIVESFSKTFPWISPGKS